MLNLSSAMHDRVTNESAAVGLLASSRYSALEYSRNRLFRLIYRVANNVQNESRMISRLDSETSANSRSRRRARSLRFLSPFSRFPSSRDEPRDSYAMPIHDSDLVSNNRGNFLRFANVHLRAFSSNCALSSRLLCRVGERNKYHTCSSEPSLIGLDRVVASELRSGSHEF